jgi:hypothetical protein
LVEHIVIFKLKAESTPADEQQLIAMLQDLKGNIPSGCLRPASEPSAGERFCEAGLRIGNRRRL